MPQYSVFERRRRGRPVGESGLPEVNDEKEFA
jgi:hypothetical protein